MLPIRYGQRRKYWVPVDYGPEIKRKIKRIEDRVKLPETARIYASRK